MLFVSSEIYPLAKTGGLADVSAALPDALAALGVDMRLIIPGYPRAIASVVNKTVEIDLEDFMGAGPMRLISGRTPDTRLPVWLVDCPSLFERSGGLYQDDDGRDWPDNARRFAVFGHVAAEVARGALGGEWQADLVHGNDWHAGLVPAILAETKGAKPATLFTMHNLAYQGLFPAEAFAELGLPPKVFGPQGMEFWGKASFLKAGIAYSDRLTTVSPSYAQEILTSEFGCGLEGLLKDRARDLVGILNGVDYRIWDPASDTHIPANFTARKTAGKRACKAAAQAEFGLEVDREVPLVFFMSRFTDQKMADVVAAALPEITQLGAQCVLLGDGDRHLEEEFDRAARRHPGQIAARVGYEEPLAHLLLAGGDILLHPARYEPCGLTQLYAMRYGTLPVVRDTGGLSDTVVDATESAIAAGTATGFAFRNIDGTEMLDCLKRALTLYRQPLVWRKLQRQAMAQNFGWAESARHYLEVYRGLVPQAAETALEPMPAEFPLEKAAG
ncbi:MAG TPA: glycogen synthase GlgA [Stellaceae bacterium]|nr:glycogen synthase GlgA [Stellaceae bacterium]